MSTKFFKYNQAGVGETIRFSKKGGTIGWDDGAKRFIVQDSAGNGAVEILPVNALEYGALSSKINDSTLVTAGYVKGLVQGFRTKASVQSAVVDLVNGSPTAIDLPASAFDNTAGFSKDPDAIFAGLTRKVFQVFGLHRFGSGPDNNILSPGAKQQLQDDIIKGYPDTDSYNHCFRVLVKDQSDAAQNGIYELRESGNGTNYYLKRTTDMDVEDEAEGAYVFVQDGVLEGTGWLGEIVGMPASLNDPFAPALGARLIKFNQFHGKGTYTAKDGIIFDSNEFRLDYRGLTATADGAKIKSANIAIQTDAADGKQAYNRITFADMLTAYNVNSYKISDKSGKFSVSVAGAADADGNAIEFVTGDDPAGRDGQKPVLSITGEKFALNYSDAAFKPDIDAVASSIELVAGDAGDGSLGTNQVGGGVRIAAGKGFGAGKGGDIVLVPGTGASGNLDGILHVDSNRYIRVPVGSNVERGVPATPADAAGAIRMNNELRNAEGLNVFEYFNGTEWIQVEGSSYMIHDDKQAGETGPYDTYMSAAGYLRDVSGKVIKSDTDAIDAVVDGQHVLRLGKETFGVEIRSLDKVVISAGPGDRYDPATPAAIEATKGSDLDINTIGASEVGHTFGTRKGATSTGNITIHSGENTTTTGGKSGTVSVYSGNHAIETGSIVIKSGDVISGTSTGSVGNIEINAGALPDALAPEKAGTIFIGANKEATVSRNKIAIGTVNKTLTTSVQGKLITIGVTDPTKDEASTKITIGTGGSATSTHNTGIVSVNANTVDIRGSSDLNGGAVIIESSKIQIGSDANTKTIEIGYTAPADINNPVRDLSASVQVGGDNITITADKEFKIVNANQGGLNSGILFDTGTTKGVDGLINGVGMLHVANEEYTNYVSKNTDIPNVGYIKKMIGTGELGGAGTRVIDVAKIYRSQRPDGTDYPLGSKIFQVGAVLPKSARITKVSVTVASNFKFAAASSTIKVRMNSTATTNQGRVLMDSTADFDAYTSTTAGDTYIAEFGSLRAGDQVVFIEFDEAPDLSTLPGEITVVVDFISAKWVDTESV